MIKYFLGILVYCFKWFGQSVGNADTLIQEGFDLSNLEHFIIFAIYLFIPLKTLSIYIHDTNFSKSIAPFHYISNDGE